MNTERLPIHGTSTDITSNAELLRAAQKNREQPRMEEPSDQDLYAPPTDDEIDVAFDSIRQSPPQTDLITQVRGDIDRAAANANTEQTETVTQMKPMQAPTPTPPTLLKRVGGFLGRLFRKKENKTESPWTDDLVRKVQAELAELRQQQEETPPTTTYAKATGEATTMPPHTPKERMQDDENDSFKKAA